VEARAHAIAELEDALRREREGRAKAEEELARREAALHAREAELAVRDITIADKDRELAARRGWRWWLKLPLIRLGLLK
jgi:uncharacterized protein (DUF3084 family)